MLKVHAVLYKLERKKIVRQFAPKYWLL